MANQGKDFPFKAGFLSGFTCSEPPFCAVAARVGSALRGWGLLFYCKITQTPLLVVCGALVVVAVLWIPQEGLGAAAAYGQVEE